MDTESKQAIFIYFYEYQVIKDMTQVSMWIVSFLASISTASISTSFREEYCLSSQWKQTLRLLEAYG